MLFISAQGGADWTPSESQLPESKVSTPAIILSAARSCEGDSQRKLVPKSPISECTKERFERSNVSFNGDIVRFFYPRRSM
jgi:hypothetical protein